MGSIEKAGAGRAGSCEPSLFLYQTLIVARSAAAFDKPH